MKNKRKHRVLAKRILGYIQAFPDRHDQDSYVGNEDEVLDTGNICNTTMCVAGTAVYLDGGTPALRRLIRHDEDGDLFFDSGRKLLGLTHEEARDLFHCYNNKAALKMLKAVAKGDEEQFEAEHNKYWLGSYN